MARAFKTATAEQVIAATSAAVAYARGIDKAEAAAFCDTTETAAEGALELAADIGLLIDNGDGTFSADGPLARFTQNPDPLVKAAMLRVALENYEPFTVFRDRLLATADTREAAAQCRALLDLDAHRDDVSQTLADLGTFAHALKSSGGGQHAPVAESLEVAAVRLADASDERSAAEQGVRERLTVPVADTCSAPDVIRPLADAALHAARGDLDGTPAVTNAGNAVESYLAALAARQNVNVANANGINAKADRLKQHANLPKKIRAVAGYLGHVRNAADHGTDADVGAAWAITAETGREYVSVATSFIRACHRWEHGEAPAL